MIVIHCRVDPGKSASQQGENNLTTLKVVNNPDSWRLLWAFKTGHAHPSQPVVLLS